MKHNPSFLKILFPLITVFILARGLKTTVVQAQDFFFTDSAEYQKIRIDRVLRADTVVLENGEKIRLIGIRAPEAPKREEEERDQYGFIIEKENPLMTIEERALDFARELLEGQYVRVEFDVQKKDENFVSLGYLFTVEGNIFVNAEIVRQGFARLHIRPPNIKYAEVLREAYREAREEKRGLQGE